MKYECNICDKLYSSYSGLWKHKKKIHNKEQKTNNVECSYCNGMYSSLSSLSHHKKKCKQNPSNIKTDDSEDSKISISLIKELLPKLVDTLNNVTEKNSQGQIHNFENNNNSPINNTNSNNPINSNNQINNITISLGNENLSEIVSKNDQIKILKQKNDALIEIIKLVHFGSKYPQFHNIAIDGEKAYQYNEFQKKFLETPKEDMLYDLIENRVNDIYDFNEENKLSLSKKTYSWIKSYTNMFEIETKVKQSIKQIEPVIELESSKLLINKQIKL
jgi:DNA-directed RNA polymerase subunit RPC12/RpoP